MTEVRFDAAEPHALLKVEIGVLSARTCAEKQQLRCRLVFGCDGMNSIVRTALERIEPAFGTSTISTPSAGLVFRAMLCANPDGFKTTQGVGVLSSSAKASMYGVRNAAHAESLNMLPFAGDPSAPRPIGCVRVRSSDNKANPNPDPNPNPNPHKVRARGRQLALPMRHRRGSVRQARCDLPAAPGTEAP